MNYIITIAASSYLGALGACLIAYFFFASRMWKGRKPDVGLSNVGWNPFNICFRPSLLTESGLRARKFWFISSGGFILLIGAPWLLMLLKR